MTKSVYIANNPTHVLHSISLIKKGFFNEKNIIIWSGAIPLTNFFPKDSLIFDYDLIDLSNFKIDSFFDFQRNYPDIRKVLSTKVDKIDYLITCFDTHLLTEALRHEHKVSWQNVGILEDGIGNYFPSTMPVLKKQIPKSFLNFLLNGYFLNMTKRNLGGNPKVGFISALMPEYVYKHKKSKAQIIPNKKEFISILNELRIKIPEAYFKADALISLTPVLAQKRMTDDELIEYIHMIINHDDMRGIKNFLIKPHPRENLSKLKKVIKNEFGESILIGDQKPIELYLPALQNMTWTGFPSSGFLNSYFLYGNKNKFIVFPLFHMPFSGQVLKALKRLMGSALEIRNTN